MEANKHTQKIVENKEHENYSCSIKETYVHFATKVYIPRFFREYNYIKGLFIILDLRLVIKALT